MNTILYKHRTIHGIVEYEIIDGNFGDDTLILRDTSCTHSGPKCEIEVVKCEDGECYQYSKPLNWTAEEYEYFHKLEKFWATKKEALVEGLAMRIKWNYESIADCEKRIAEAEERLNKMESTPVNYFTHSMAKLGATCFVADEETCRIIGIIQFENGTTGFLTDSNYYDDNCDGYPGDRIILIENKADGRITTENGDTVYVSREDFENSKTNKKVKQLTDSIANNQKSIKQSTLLIERFNYIISIKDTLTYEQLKEMINS